jgi:uncharacterized protein YegP (UPF0339 family)
MGKFSITKKGTGQFYFCLKSNNGMVILGSEGYRAKADCENAIASVKRHTAEMFDRKKASNGKHYFNIKAADGQIICKSQQYVTSFALEKGIESVIKNALHATVEDRTINRIGLKI